MGWSPKQIAGRMELDGSEHRVSAELIYRHADSPVGRQAGLPRLLAQRKPKRGRRRRNGRREPAIPNRTPIHQRPTKAHLRSQFGHWEGDLMHFRRQRDILLTLQERRSRVTLARRLHSKDADLTAKAIAAELGGLPARARRTITHDNGGEFARHEAVTDAIGLDAYFCDPHSPWQRGSIENANGLLRRDLPRKTALTEYTDADIDDVTWNLNATPRKCLGYRTPIEAFAANLGVALEGIEPFLLNAGERFTIRSILINGSFDIRPHARIVGGSLMSQRDIDNEFPRNVVKVVTKSGIRIVMAMTSNIYYC